jgi:hypothetical protein
MGTWSQDMIVVGLLLLAFNEAWAEPSPLVTVQSYQRGPSREEMNWRRRHYEIPLSAPYTPGYGPYIENGYPRFQGTPNPYYREEYPRIEYPRVFRCWRDGPC